MKYRDYIRRITAGLLVLLIVFHIAPLDAENLESDGWSVIHSESISVGGDTLNDMEEETEERSVYAFGDNQQILLSELLDQLNLPLDSILSLQVRVSDNEAVSLKREIGFLSYDYRITANHYFDRVLLTVSTRRYEHNIVLRNPAPLDAGTPVTSAVGVFMADTTVPADTELTVTDYIPRAEEITLLASVTDEDAHFVWLDLSLVAQGKKLETGASVKLFTEIALPEAPALAGFTGHTALRDLRLFHLTEAGLEELPATSLIVDGKISSIRFETASFSVFAVAYTVDFVYDGGYYNIPGGTYVFLSDLLEALHIDIPLTNISNVRFSNETLIDIEALEGDWRLTSLAPFVSYEALTLSLTDGSVVVVQVTDEQAVHYADLSELLKSMVIYVDGEEVHNGDTVDVRDGMLYDLVLTFQENSSKQFADDDQLYFALPSNFTLPDDFADSLTINLGIDGKVYGNKLTYDKEHNRLLLDWNTEDRKYERMTAAGNLRFTVRLQGYIDPGSVKYGDSYSFIANRYDPHNASVAKSGVLNAEDLEHQTITYTVTVRSDGSTENLILTDVLGTALSYSNESVTWSRVSLMEAQAEARKVEPMPVGTEASDTAPSLQYTSEGMVISIPETHDGDVLTFTYTADVDYTKIASSGNASFDEMGNTVQIYGDSDPTDNKAEFHQKEVAYSDLLKSVSESSARYKAGEHEYQNLTWTINTNSYKMISFRNTDITDQITVYTDSADDPQVMSLPTEYIGDGITIEVYEFNADRSESVLKETRNIPWSELSVTDMDATKGWTYHVPESDGLYEYRITYQTRTDVTNLSQNADVHNTATSRGGTDEVSKLLHPKGNGLGVSKRVVNQTEDDVTWEITVVLNDIAEGWNQRLVVEDLLPYRYLPKKNGETGSDLYKESYIEGTLEVYGLQEGEDYELFASQPSGWWGDDNHVKWRDSNATWDQANWPLIRAGHRYEENDNEDFKNNENNRNAIFVEFFQDSAKETVGLKAPAGGGDSRTITIRFKSSINKEWRDWAWEYYGEKAIWNGLRHTNDVYANTQHEKAEVIVTGNYLVKTFKSQWADLEKSKQYGTPNWQRFETYIAGKQSGSTIVIDDYFDGTLWRFASEMEVQFRAGNEPNYARQVSTPGHSEYWVAGEYGSSIDLLEDGHVRFIITDLPLKADGTTWPFYGVNYYLSPNGEEAWKAIQMEALNNGGIVRYINTATSEGMTDSDQYPVYLLPEYKPVDKSEPIIVPDQNDMVEYTIVLNQQKQRLNDGNQITMEDEFNRHLSIDYSSITIATEPSGHEEEISYDYRGYIGTFVIPDETKVTITYQARVVPDQDATWTDNKTEVIIYNVANMLGWKDGGEKTITVTKGGDAEIFRIRLFKYGSGHMESGLNGAVFGLYQKVDDQYVPMTYLNGNNRGEKITFTTGTVSMLNGIVQSDSDLEKLTEEEKSQLITRDGYALVELSQSEHGVHLEKEKTYYLKEEEVPEGYQKDSTVEYYSFTFNDSPEYNDGGWVYYNNDILKVRNSPTDGAFSIRKKIDGNYSLSNEQQSSLRFTVQKKNSDSWEEVTVSIPQTDENGEIETDENGETIYVTVTDLTYDQIKDGLTIDHIGAGTFRIVESVVSGGIAVPGSVDHNVSFTVDDVEDDLTQDTDGKKYVQFEITEADIAGGIEHEIAFTDTYTQETVNLKAQKSWLDAENIARVPGGAKITLGVYVVTNGVLADEPVQTVELDGTPDVNSSAATGESASWAAQFAKLPKKDDNGEEITYAVKEISGLSGYDVFYGKVGEEAEWLILSSDKTGRVINKQQTVSYTVDKRWSTTTILSNASITIGIFYGSTEAEAYAKYSSGAKTYKSVTLPDENGWKATFSSLPKGDGNGQDYVWIAVETSEQAGYEANYPDEKAYLVLSNDSTMQQMITNGPKPAIVDISGEKVLIGRILKDQEFSFSLSPEYSDAAKYETYPGGFDNSMQQIISQNNAEGKFAFHLMYTAEDYTQAKTKDGDTAYFYYVVKEVIPDANEKEESITYDEAQFLVRVELSQDLNYRVKYYHYTVSEGIPEEARPSDPSPQLTTVQI